MVQQAGQMPIKSCQSTMRRGQTFLAAFTAAETASRPGAAMAPAQATLATRAAAEAATRARTGAQARSAAVPVCHATSRNPAVAAVAKAGMEVLKPNRASRHAASRVAADMGDRRRSLTHLCARNDRCAGASDLTHGNAIAHASAATDSGAIGSTKAAAHYCRSCTGGPINLMTAARSAAAARNDASRAAGGPE